MSTRWLVRNIKRVDSLYRGCTVYGPYTKSVDGRRRVLIQVSDKKITKLYAKLKLEVKLGRVLSKDETVDHIDGNALNDRSSNLRCLTRGDNAREAHRLGKSTAANLIKFSRSKEGRCSSRVRMTLYNPNSVIPRDNVVRLRNLYKKGMSRREIALKIKVTDRSVKNMLLGKTFSDLPEALTSLRRGANS